MPTTPRGDMDSLLDVLLRHAQELLQKYGEFFPFGAAMSVDEEIHLSSAYTGSERPQSQAVIDLLYEGFGAAEAEGKIRAAGVSCEIRLRDRLGDAIQVALEHSDADPVNVFLPYVKHGRTDPKYGELFATKGERRVFI